MRESHEDYVWEKARILTKGRELIEFVSSFEVQVQHKSARVGPRLEMVIERNVGTAGDRYRFEIAADASVNEHRMALDLPAIEGDEAMARFARELMFRLRLHNVAHVSD